MVFGTGLHSLCMVIFCYVFGPDDCCHSAHMAPKSQDIISSQEHLWVQEWNHSAANHTRVFLSELPGAVRLGLLAAHFPPVEQFLSLQYDAVAVLHDLWLYAFLRHLLRASPKLQTLELTRESVRQWQQPGANCSFCPSRYRQHKL